MHAEHIAMLSGGSLVSNADLRQADNGEWELHGDPTEAAFLVAERKLGVTEKRERRFERVGEIPFSSERKLMSSIERDHEQGVSGPSAWRWSALGCGSANCANARCAP